MDAHSGPARTLLLPCDPRNSRGGSTSKYMNRYVNSISYAFPG